MAFDIGKILTGIAPVLVVIVLTWWCSVREKRKRNERRRRNEKNNTSQETGKDPMTLQSTHTDPISDIVSTMYVFFDEMGIAFDLSTEKDSVECFTIGFEGKNGEITMRVYVMTDRDMYQIIGQQKTFIPESNRDAALGAINRYNMEANTVSGCISADGTVTFWIGRYTDGNAFSIDSFAREFNSVLAATEDTTDQILKKSYAPQ